MSKEDTRGFVTRLQAKSVADGERLSYSERKYVEAVDRVAKKKKRAITPQGFAKAFFEANR